MIHRIPNCGFAKSYLIEEDDGLAVVDVGSIGAAKEIENYCLNILARPLQNIRLIAITHFHIDHIGGIGTLLQKCSPETKVLFHPFVEEYLDGKRNLSRMQNWFTGLLPTMLGSLAGIGKLSDISFENAAGIPLTICEDYRYLPYEDRISYIDSGLLSRYAPGFDCWGIITTPGHTEDSVSFFNQTTRELICGDLILGRKDGTGYLNPFYGDKKTIIRSYRAVNDIKPQTIYPGHGEIIRDKVSAVLKVKKLPVKPREFSRHLPITPGSTGMLSPFPYR